MVPARSNRAWVFGLLLLVLCISAFLALSALLGKEAIRYAVDHRGVESGLRSDNPPVAQPRLAVNVFLEQYPDLISLDEALTRAKELGAGTIRQRLAWSAVEPLAGQYEWDSWDMALNRARDAGLDIVLILDTSPPWARPEWEADNPWAPPTSTDDYARFVRAVVSRYGDLVQAYQIWDSPNISPHWGKGPIDPAGYVDLLQSASQEIRSADPDAVVIAGGLAPNLESGGQNMSDVLFLREIYRRGAGAYFDVLGAKVYGFWTGPEDRRVDPGVLNHSRVILLREEMRRRGETHKPIWALESGWCALPSGWIGDACPLGSDLPSIQMDRTARALERTHQEWPWLGKVFVGHLEPDASLGSYRWGYALQTPDGELTPLGELMADAAHDPTLYPGAYASPSIASSFIGEPGGELVTLRVWGTDLLLTVNQGVGLSSLQVEMPGVAMPVEIDLGGVPGESDQVTLRLGRVPQLHEIQVRGTPAERRAIAGLRIAARESHTRFAVTMGLGALGILILGLLITKAGRPIPWREAWAQVTERYAMFPSGARGAVSAGAFWLVACAPDPALRLAGLGVYALSACLQPRLSLLTAIACIPLAPIHTQLGPGSFSLAEVSLWCAFGAHLWSKLLAASATTPAKRTGLLRRLSLIDWGMVALLVLGFLTSFRAEYRRVAFRELRTVVLAACLIYYLVRRWAKDEVALSQITYVLWYSAVAVASYALLLYPTAAGVIEAEGVRRARGFFGSPNNLALYLERLLPLGLAFALGATKASRRRAHVAGALVLLIATLLTFSRGAWLLGLPAGALLLAALAKKKSVIWRALGLGLVVIAMLWMALALAPDQWVPERLATLLDLGHGTTGLRIKLWGGSLEMLRDHPWLGVGLDNFLYYYGDYVQAGAEADLRLSHPHNLLLDFWLRLGLGGVVVLTILVLGTIKTSLLVVRRQKRTLPLSLQPQSQDLRVLTIGLIAGLGAAAGHGMVDAGFFVVELALWFALVLAWLGQVSELP